MTRRRAPSSTLTRSATLIVDFSASGGGFDVQFSYTYAEELSGATFSVFVTDNLSTASALTASFRVSDAAFTAATFPPPDASEGAAVTNGAQFASQHADPAGSAHGSPAFGPPAGKPSG
mgnify:CR=1 FL=1